jgi:hypothetical protein
MRWDLAQILSGETIRRTAEVAAQTSGNVLRVVLRVVESGTFWLSRN